MDNKALGIRIAKLRKISGLSGEELSKKIGISRPSLVQIEQGNRNIKVEELKSIAEILNFSMDAIMSEDYNIEELKTRACLEEAQAIYERISVPEINVNKFKNLIIYILEKCAGKPNVGETVLYKLLYFSDFNYYEIYEEHLSGAKYRKLPNGPVPISVDTILDSMVNVDNSLQRFKTEYYGYKQKRYMPLINADLRLFNAAEIEVVDKVINQLSFMSATEINHYSHEDMPCKVSKDMEMIDYELAFYRTAPYSVRKYNPEEEYGQE